jgi:hypothetical protein
MTLNPLSEAKQAIMQDFPHVTDADKRRRLIDAYALMIAVAPHRRSVAEMGFKRSKCGFIHMNEGVAA